MLIIKSLTQIFIVSVDAENLLKYNYPKGSLHEKHNQFNKLTVLMSHFFNRLISLYEAKPDNAHCETRQEVTHSPALEISDY
jgi:glutathionylspermidine synthase